MTTSRLEFRRFTLLELLLASMVAAMAGALLVGAFHAGLSSYKKVDQRERQLLETEAAFLSLRSDLSRFVPIEGEEPSFERDGMTFTIAASSPRSRLERVSYRVKDGALKRLSAPLQADDGASSPLPSELLRDLGSLAFSYSYASPDGIAASAGFNATNPAPRHDGGVPSSVAVEGAMLDGRPLLASISLPVFNSTGNGKKSHE